MSEPEPGRTSRRRLSVFLLSMGTLHFVAPSPFERLVPRWLGSARFWVYFSGLWELTSGALLLTRRTKKVGGYAAAATMVAVFPGNIKMAVDSGRPRDVVSAGAWARLPLQVPLVAWALRQTRAAA